MNIFSKGDRVRIISPKHGHEGKLFVIVEVLGSDDLAHELPYRISNNFWYKASELVLVQPAYAKEYAIGAPPAAETGARGDDDYPPADWTPPPLVGAMVMFDELLNQLSGKLSPSARQMLRTHFAAEHSIRTDAEAELASVRDQLAAAQSARDAARELLFEKGIIARRHIEALKWYADPENWKKNWNKDGHPEFAVYDDNGDTAREALETTEQ